MILSFESPAQVKVVLERRRRWYPRSVILTRVDVQKADLLQSFSLINCQGQASGLCCVPKVSKVCLICDLPFVSHASVVVQVSRGKEARKQRW